MTDRPQLVFVLGGRRTGTTLVNAILCSDRTVNPLLPEVQVLTRLLEAQRWTIEHFDRFGSAYFTHRDDVRAVYRTAAEAIVERVATRHPTAATLVLKNPELSNVAGELARVFPAARFVVCVRDPRDQVASEVEVGERRIAAGGGAPLVRDRRFDRLTEFYLGYFEETALLAAAEPGRVMYLRYEDVVGNVAGALERLRRFTGLELADFDPAAEWRVAPEFDFTDGQPWQTERHGKGVDPSGVGRFAADLEAEAIATIERVAAGFMARFGYA